MSSEKRQRSEYGFPPNHKRRNDNSNMSPVVYGPPPVDYERYNRYSNMRPTVYGPPSPFKIIGKLVIFIIILAIIGVVGLVLWLLFA